MEWFSWVIAIGIGLSAVISPIVTAVINNIHQSKQESIKNYELAKRKALEDFVENASKCYNSPSPSQKENYIKSANILYIYFSKIPPEVSDLLYNKNDEFFKRDLTNIVRDLSKQITKQ